MYLDQTEVKFGLSYYYYYFNHFQGHETSVISQFSFFRRNRRQQHRTRAADIFVFIDYARTKPRMPGSEVD